jgi:hypothetical protein
LKTEASILTLADKKLAVAEFLLNNQFYDDAYYLAGYSFELYLKAKICKTLVIADFFDFDSTGNRKIPRREGKSKINDQLYKPFKVHDFEQLLILSGLYSEFCAKTADLQFMGDWSVVSKWDESLRYSTGAKKPDVESFIESIKNMILWLKLYL